jgi:hypothetical protein
MAAGTRPPAAEANPASSIRDEINNKNKSVAVSHLARN